MPRAPRSLAVAVVLAACATAQPDTRSVDAADRVLVEDIGLPPAVTEYRVAEVEDFGHPDAGSAARYVAADSLTRLPRLDVIVYPARHGVAVEAAIARRGLMEYDRRSPNVNRTAFEDERWFSLESGDSAYAATLSMEVRGNPSRSLLYLHRVGSRFIKVRTTFPMPVGAGPDATIGNAVRAIFDQAAPAPGAD